MDGRAFAEDPSTQDDRFVSFTLRFSPCPVGFNSNSLQKLLKSGVLGFVITYLICSVHFSSLLCPTPQNFVLYIKMIMDVCLHMNRRGPLNLV